MFDIKDVHNMEKAIVGVLNIFGWDLKWTGGKYEHYDCRGLTPKGYECVIEMKFRKDYYKKKLLEKYKYDQLMSMDKSIVKLYFVNDPKANYMFWLNELKLNEKVNMWCPSTTLWNSKKIRKECYLIDESQAVITNIN